MKAFVFETNGEPLQVLGLQELPDLAPGPGEVAVRILLTPYTPRTCTSSVAAMAANHDYPPAPASKRSGSSRSSVQA